MVSFESKTTDCEWNSLFMIWYSKYWKKYYCRLKYKCDNNNNNNKPNQLVHVTTTEGDSVPQDIALALFKRQQKQQKTQHNTTWTQLHKTKTQINK